MKIIPLVAVGAVFVASLAASFYFYQENDDLKAQIQELQGAITERDNQIARLRPPAPRARRLPLRWTITSKGAPGPEGYVLHLFNLEPVPLRIQITLTALNRTLSQNQIIDGGKFWNVAQLALNDHITVLAAGYDSDEIDVH